MLFALTCLDRTDAGELRQRNRARHLAYLEMHADQLVYAGPLLDKPDGRPVGSLLIVDVPDRTAAEAFAEGDPYAEAGLFDEVTIRLTRQVFPRH